MPAQSSRELVKFRVIQIGYDPVGHVGAVPVEDLVALRVLLLDSVVRRAVVCDRLAHALLDLQGGKYIPGFSARARLAPTPGVPRYSDRIPPSTWSPRRSSGGSGSLARPLP